MATTRLRAGAVGVGIASTAMTRQLGAQVWIKVTNVQASGRGPVKIGCSMRAVDQKTGEDLDPGNVQPGRRAPGPGPSGTVSESPPEVRGCGVPDLESVFSPMQQHC